MDFLYLSLCEYLLGEGMPEQVHTGLLNAPTAVIVIDGIVKVVTVHLPTIGSYKQPIVRIAFTVA